MANEKHHWFSGRIAVGCLIIIAVVMAIVIGIVAESDAPGPKTAHAVVGAPVVKVGDYYPPILNMTIDVGDVPRNGDIVIRAADATKKVGEGFASGHPPVQGKVTAINFTVVGPKRGGAGDDHKVLHYTIDRATLVRLIKAGASGPAILNAAREFSWWSPSNDDVMRDYCAGTSTLGICSQL